MTAEQKARATYENFIRLSDGPGVRDALKFLRKEKLFTSKRFGETLRIVEEYKKMKKHH